MVSVRSACFRIAPHGSALSRMVPHGGVRSRMSALFPYNPAWCRTPRTSPHVRTIPVYIEVHPGFASQCFFRASLMAGKQQMFCRRQFWRLLARKKHWNTVHFP